MAFFHDGALRPAQAASAVRRVHYELRALPRPKAPPLRVLRQRRDFRKAARFDKNAPA